MHNPPNTGGVGVGWEIGNGGEEEPQSQHSRGLWWQENEEGLKKAKLKKIQRSKEMRENNQREGRDLMEEEVKGISSTQG